MRFTRRELLVASCGLAACVKPLVNTHHTSRGRCAPTVLVQSGLDAHESWLNGFWKQEVVPVPVFGSSDDVIVGFLGVGAVVVAYESAAFVFPTTLRCEGRARAVIGPLDPRIAFDRLFVSPLHAHYDHANHPEIFATAFRTPACRVQVIGNERVVARAQRRNPPPSTSLVFGPSTTCRRTVGNATWTVTYTRQEHARHWGAGRRVSEQHSMTGIRFPAFMTRRGGDTYSATIRIATPGRRFDVFVNDAATPARASGVPSDPGPVDLAVITAADFHLVHNYPDPILDQLEPREVWWGHWEEFVFRGKHSLDRETSPLTSVHPVFDVERLLDIQAIRPTALLPLSPLWKAFPLCSMRG